MKGAFRKAIAAVTGFIIALVLLTALLLIGIYLLTHAAILSLSPYLGQAGAMALVGFVCVLLLVAIFWRMAARSSTAKKGVGASPKGTYGTDKLREVIRKNPLESALTAFAVGVVQESDLRLTTLLMQGGMELMERTAQQESEEQVPPPSQDREACRQ